MKRPVIDHTVRMPDEAWQALRKAWWKSITDADYKKAFRLITPAHKKYPNDYKIIYLYASTLADYGETFGAAKKAAYKRQGCVLLAGLLKRLHGVDRAWAYSTRNEYYYHSEQFNKQYALGVERVAEKDKGGYYSQGVGAAWHAYGLAVKGRQYSAWFWAKRAVRAWENFFRFKADYYNAYVHYALALGILGRTDAMEAALDKSAGLSGKSRSYREFREVRENIAGLDKKPRPGRQ